MRLSENTLYRSPLPLVWLIMTLLKSLLETVLGIWSTSSNPVLSF